MYFIRKVRLSVMLRKDHLYKLVPKLMKIAPKFSLKNVSSKNNNAKKFQHDLEQKTQIKHTQKTFNQFGSVCFRIIQLTWTN